MVVCPVSKSIGMKPIMYTNPQERLLDEKTLPVVVQELKQRATLGLASSSIVCDLSSSSGLTLDAALQLAELLQARNGLFALDLSLNRIKADSWGDVCRLARRFVDAVEYLDLSLNYLHHCSRFKKTRLLRRN